MSGVCLMQRFVKKCQSGWPVEVMLPAADHADAVQQTHPRM
jgi:hypothetical protein